VPEGGRGSTFSVSQRFLGKPSGFELHLPALIASAGALLLGFVLDLTLLYAAAWTLALWSWIRARTVPATAGLGQLAVLPLMAFPWINLDFAPLGWWFRISAAWIAEHGFSGLGFLVARQGTSLVVHGLPIDVAPACSGMHALQTILIAGIALSWVKLGGRPTFWLAVATLPALAWIANALRICATVFVALNWGTPFAQEHFHDVGGWVVMMGVLALWWMALGTSSTRLRCQPASP
jgi:exosortase/archaeosortase family protein